MRDFRNRRRLYVLMTTIFVLAAEWCSVRPVRHSLCQVSRRCLSVARSGWMGAERLSSRADVEPAACIGDGRLRVLIGSEDVTALFDGIGTGTVLRYRARSLRLHAGPDGLIVYAVRDREWTELSRLPIRVLTPSGFATSDVTPSVSVNNKGQLAEGHSGLQPRPDRPRIRTSGSAAECKLRMSEASGRSDAIESYAARRAGTGAAIRSSAGPRAKGRPRGLLGPDRAWPSVALARQRQRGCQPTPHQLVRESRCRARIGGQRVSVSLAALNGSSIVGWDNITGLENDKHRVQSGTLNSELVPARPGALHVDATLMNGSLLPQTAFTQGGVVDAERSTGGGVQLSAASPSQRVRIAAGVSRSRFDNPRTIASSSVTRRWWRCGRSVAGRRSSR